MQKTPCFHVEKMCQFLRFLTVFWGQKSTVKHSQFFKKVQKPTVFYCFFLVKKKSKEGQNYFFHTQGCVKIAQECSGSHFKKVIFDNLFWHFPIPKTECTFPKIPYQNPLESSKSWPSRRVNALEFNINLGWSEKKIIEPFFVFWPWLLRGFPNSPLLILWAF